MPEWIKLEAEKIRTETLRLQKISAERAQHAALVAQTSSVFWDGFVSTMQADVTAWNAEFPDEPDQQLEIEQPHASTFRLFRPSRGWILSVEASDTGIRCDRHAKAADGSPGRRELPIWNWAVGANGVLGVHEDKKTLTGPALSELLIRRLLDSSHA